MDQKVKGQQYHWWLASVHWCIRGLLICLTAPVKKWHSEGNYWYSADREIWRKRKSFSFLTFSWLSNFHLRCSWARWHCKQCSTSAAALWLHACALCIMLGSQQFVFHIVFVSFQTTLPTRRRCSPSATSGLVSIRYRHTRTTAAGRHGTPVMSIFTMVT